MFGKTETTPRCREVASGRTTGRTGVGVDCSLGRSASHEHRSCSDHGLCERLAACPDATVPSAWYGEAEVAIDVDRDERSHLVPLGIQAKAPVDAQSALEPDTDPLHAGGRDEIPFSQAARYEAGEETDDHHVFHLDDRAAEVSIEDAAEGGSVSHVDDRGILRVRRDN